MSYEGLEFKKIKGMIMDSNANLFEKWLRVTIYKKLINVFYGYDKVQIQLSQLHELLNLAESYKGDKEEFFEECKKVFTFQN